MLGHIIDFFKGVNVPRFISAFISQSLSFILIEIFDSENVFSPILIS